MRYTSPRLEAIATLPFVKAIDPIMNHHNWFPAFGFVAVRVHQVGGWLTQALLTSQARLLSPGGVFETHLCACITMARAP